MKRALIVIGLVLASITPAFAERDGPDHDRPVRSRPDPAQDFENEMNRRTTPTTFDPEDHLFDNDRDSRGGDPDIDDNGRYTGDDDDGQEHDDRFAY